MSADRDTTRIVRSWLEEGVTALPDRVLDTVLDQIPATPQRRAWWPARRFARMNKVVPISIAAAAVVVVAILGYNLLPRSGGIGGQLTPGPTAGPTASPVPSIPVNMGSPLGPGTYALSQFPVGVTFQVPAYEVPAQWFTCSENAVEQNVCFKTNDAEPPTAVAFLILENVVADPCGTDGALVDPPVGPSVDDMVTAITGLDGFTATAPRDVTVDGFAGKEFTLTAPETPDCGATWATSERINGMGAGEVNLVRILDVNGTRIVISGAYHPTSPVATEYLAAIQQFIESIRIQSS